MIAPSVWPRAMSGRIIPATSPSRSSARACSSSRAIDVALGPEVVEDDRPGLAERAPDDALRVAFARRVAGLELADERLTLWIHVGDGDLADLAPVVEDVHDAAVRERRNGKLGELLERRLVVERRGEDAARLGEELEPLARGLGLPPRRLLPPVDARLVDRGRGPARDLGGEGEILLVVVAPGRARDERERTERAAARDEGDAHPGARRRQVLEGRDEAIRVGRVAREELERRLADELRLARPEHERNADGSVRVDRQVVQVLDGLLALDVVRVRERDSPDRPVLFGRRRRCTSRRAGERPCGRSSRASAPSRATPRRPRSPPRGTRAARRRPRRRRGPPARGAAAAPGRARAPRGGRPGPRARPRPARTACRTPRTRSVIAPIGASCATSGTATTECGSRAVISSR